MAATEMRSTSTGFVSSWRELARTPTYLVPTVLGGFLALLIGVLTYVFDIVAAQALAEMSPQIAYLIIFGLVGLVGYGVSKENVQNGALVAAIAGLALVAFVGGTEGLLSGLLLLLGAIWSLGKTR